jgi:three-Cys-motif partner protein
MIVLKCFCQPRLWRKPLPDYVDDPADSLPSEVVGAWSIEKHERLKRYVDASHATRRKYLRRSEAAYVDLFCGPGRVTIRGTDEFLDGGVLAACRMAREKGAPFSVVHIGDANADLVDSCAHRLVKLGENVVPHYGRANKTVEEICAQLNRYGLHLAYLDPYDLGSLSFSIIERLSGFHRMDSIINVSHQDLQRNFVRYLTAHDSPLDLFAPGWRTKVDISSRSTAETRAAVLDHWLELVRGLDMAPSRGELIRASKGQRLYWLMFVSRHPLADRLWNAIRNIGGQTELPI